MSLTIMDGSFATTAAAERVDIGDTLRLQVLLMGREPGARARAGAYAQRDMIEALNRLVQSPEFQHRVQQRLLRGLAPAGGLYDAPPSAELIRWAAARLPLGEAGRLAVAAAVSWLDLFGAVFGDKTFRDSVHELDEALAQAGYIADPPIGPVRQDDIGYFNQFFLGRAPESHCSQQDLVGGDIAAAINRFAGSPEFTTHLRELLNGRLPAGADDLADETLGWASERLPLSRATRETLWLRESRVEAIEAIFADPCFTAVLDDPHVRANVPTLANEQDVVNLYRLFLGREPESEPRTSGWFGMEIMTAMFHILASDEYSGVIRPEIMTAADGLHPLFDGAHLEELRKWASGRLPLSPGVAKHVLAANSWYALASVVLGDPTFWAAIGATALRRLREHGQRPPIAIQIGVIDASRLFERDWYLGTYKTVAASGGDPLEHYVHHGYREGYNPNRLFNTTWYYSAHPEVRVLGLNPLVHYILEGAKAGWLPHPFFPSTPVLSPAVEGYPLTPLALFTRELLPAEKAKYPEFDAYDCVRAIEALDEARDRAAKQRHIAVMTVRPLFVVLLTPRPMRDPQNTIESLRRQSYRSYVAVTSPDEALALEKTMPAYTYLLMIDAGDELVEDALYHLAAAINADPKLDLIYFDQDRLNASARRTAPFYKPEWSPDYLESMNYIGTCLCYAFAKVAPLLKDANSVYDLTLRVTDAPCRTRRVAKVLVSCRDNLHNYPAELQGRDIEALASRFKRTGRVARIAPCRAGASAYTTTVTVDPRPTISAVIPTAGKIIEHEGKRIDLIVNCLETISAQSDLANVEFVLIDNGDLDRSRLDRFDRLRLKFLTYDRPEVNIAAKINMGAAAAAGEVILILNDDIEPLSGDWMDRMVAQIRKPHVGLVGPKLLYPNRRIQHVGVIMSAGIPEHVNRHDKADAEGYFYSNLVTRNYSAVTGAVAMVRKDVFDEVEGYNEKLPIDFNDIDFSFKVLEAGYTVVCEPQARLIHFESVSAIRQPRPWDAEFFCETWAHRVDDPYYDDRHLDTHPPRYGVVRAQRRH